ncbi:YegP family protein [Avibacterium paragallinarum]|nr:YegP family protein [Avibacterium paragallinarum]
MFKGVNGQWYWRLKAANHEPIAQSEVIRPNKLLTLYRACYGH